MVACSKIWYRVGGDYSVQAVVLNQVDMRQHVVYVRQGLCWGANCAKYQRTSVAII